ncbi:MAG: type VI secretion system contractile sheath domain-containing protein [Pyrinomonadaceae bacterium]
MFPSDTDFETEVTLESKANSLADDEPFCILLLGDWSGREFHSTSSDSFESRPIEIDRDNFDDVIRKFGIKINLDLQSNVNSTVTIYIEEFDDFHPDKIFQQLSYFSHLRDIRRRLLDPDTFNNAANEVSSWFNSSGEEKTVSIEKSVQTSESQTVPDNLLDQILNQTAQSDFAPQTQTAESSELSALIGKLVKPYLIHADEEEQAKLVAIVDEATGKLMREILHHPQFQALESAWRGLYFLVKRVETDADLKIFLYDISKTELSDNLKSVDNLADSSFYRLLNDDAFDNSAAKNWAVICGNFDFHVNVDDTAMLMRLAKISKVFNAPFISHIIPKSFDNYLLSQVSNTNFDISFEPNETRLWDAIRSIPESSYIGLAFPRFLARLPFGEKTEPLETFAFEEFDTSFAANKYLWINPVFACALLLAESFSLQGWAMENRFQNQIDNLPFHIYQEDDETPIKKSMEVVLTQKVCLDLLELGIMPFISFQNSDIIRLPRFQSISLSVPFLSGKWND